MGSLKWALITLAAVGLVAGAVPLGLALLGEGGHQRELIAIIGPITAWAFIGTGLFVWWRRPDSAFGALMTAIGFTAALGALRVATEPLIFGIGLMVIPLPYAVLYHTLLGFPTGALHSRQERVLVAISYLSAIAVHPLGMLFFDTSQVGLPPNPWLLADIFEITLLSSVARFVAGVVLTLLLIAILVARWRQAGAAYRRRLLPVLLTGGAVLTLLGVWYVAGLLNAPASLQAVLEELRVALLAVVPFGFLAGAIHSRVAGATAISQLVSRFGDPVAGGRGLRDAVAVALEDPSLQLAYWLPRENRYVDIEGRPVTLPKGDEARTATIVEREGRRIAAFIHDGALDSEPERVRAAAGAVSLALDNERLQAELRAHLDELSASRARIMHVADEERRRIERNLHDGTQQRLTSVLMTLGLAESRLESDPQAAGEALHRAKSGLAFALTELRELSQGIHPSALTECGLGPAVEDLAYGAPLPVKVVADLDGRLAGPVEVAAYYVVAEALANVAKHARASAASATLRREIDELVISIADDGRGGADPARGTGLHGLADRVAALGGRLEIESPVGQGTRVVAVIPCG